MGSFGDWLSRFMTHERGVTAIEYGLIAAGIAVAIIATIAALGTNLNTAYSSVSGNLWSRNTWRRNRRRRVNDQSTYTRHDRDSVGVGCDGAPAGIRAASVPLPPGPGPFDSRR